MSRRKNLGGDKIYYGMAFLPSCSIVLQRSRFTHDCRKDTTNNSRFLILPWVKVASLASHILSRVARRVSQDWMEKYAHPIYLLETFVDCSRYWGTCYQAANWVCTGQTTGRTRNDRYLRIRTSPKDLYVYPLLRQYRNRLCREA